MLDTAPGARLRLAAQFAKFGAVGAVGVVVNIAVFNALRLSVLSPQVLSIGPLVATIVATLCAIGVNWVGNRYWAFNDGPRRRAGREAVEFFVVSIVAALIPLACLAVSHYGLRMTSLLADNIAVNVIGLGLGTLFRFTLYRWWIFSPSRRAVVDGR